MKLRNLADKYFTVAPLNSPTLVAGNSNHGKTRSPGYRQRAGLEMNGVRAGRRMLSAGSRRKFFRFHADLPIDETMVTLWSGALEDQSGYLQTAFR